MGTKIGARGAPRGAPRAAKTRSQSKTQPNQKYAFRLGRSSIFGFWSGPRRAQLRPRTPFCRPRAVKTEGQKMDPKKERQMTARGRKRDPKMGPKNRPKTDPKMDPNMISLRIGSLGLSGVGGWPRRRKCRESRSRRGGLEYVQERKGGDQYSIRVLLLVFCSV